MNANDLLIWLSAMGRGSWDRYRAAIDELHAPDDANADDGDEADETPKAGLPIYHRLRFKLQSLGHVEFFHKDFPSGWRVVPPSIACADVQGSAVGVMCGARSDALLARIERVTVGLQVDKCSQPECPDRVTIIVADQVQLRELADSTGMYYQQDAPRVLLATLPPVDNWQLRTPAELPFGTDWEVSRFSYDELQWTSASPDEARSARLGLFRFNIGYEFQYYLRLRGEAYRIAPQVGKYIILRKKRRHIVSYDADTETLSVPVSGRPPRLIDRALTLCSGLVPRAEKGRLEYGGVSRAIAIMTTQLLRQGLL